MLHSNIRHRAPFKPPVSAAKPAKDALRFKCRFQARALYTRRNCRDIQEFIVDVVEISRHQLIVRGNLTSFLPDDFTLVIGARQHGIGCTIIGRKDKDCTCHIICPQSHAMVEFLAQVRDPRITTQEIDNKLFPPGRIQLKFK